MRSKVPPHVAGAEKLANLVCLVAIPCSSSIKDVSSHKTCCFSHRDAERSLHSILNSLLKGLPVGSAQPYTSACFVFYTASY